MNEREEKKDDDISEVQHSILRTRMKEEDKEWLHTSSQKFFSKVDNGESAKLGGVRPKNSRIALSPLSGKS